MVNQGKQAVVEMVSERRERLRILDEERQVVNAELKGLELALQAFMDDSGNDLAYADEDEYKTIGQIIGDTIYTILVEAGHPLHRDVIYDRAVAKGLVIEAKNPRKYFFNVLTSDPRFKRKPGPARGIWMLANLEEDVEDGPAESC